MIFDKPKEYVELPVAQESAPLKRLLIKVEKLDDMQNVDNIIRNTREGCVTFVKVGDMRKKNIEELKIAITKLKRSCLSLDAGVVGVDEDNLLVTPSFATVVKE